ncbi:cation diffusion facilitator family transporter [Mesobacillus foraminis]|uniref:cation diffusion facilitator family transporter n=1 Tax=Mesobacillus foraminis TaxID=279826 RepID=UPI000EF54446|nr:cation diffusion facilitator family transporter [Mesobacillus foraminis]
MSHNHDINHHHTHGANKKTLYISFLIITTYMIVEVLGGYLTNSLALLADAGHMLSDSVSLAIALIAFKLGEKAASHSKTFGYKRFEILAAVLNGLTLIIIALFIFYQAINRFAHPPEVASIGMLIVSIMGLAFNILVAWIMMRGGDVEGNLNMRGAYLHVISDMLGSIGAIVAALLIMFFGWAWADSLASVIVAALVFRSGYYVLISGLHILMEGAPKNVNVGNVIQTLQNTKGIQSVHDLHVWTITSGLNALSCHVVVSEQMSIVESERLLHKVEHALANQSIHHMTIQLETSAHQHDNSILCKLKAVSSRYHHHH